MGVYSLALQRLCWRRKPRRRRGNSSKGWCLASICVSVPNGRGDFALVVCIQGLHLCLCTKQERLVAVRLRCRSMIKAGWMMERSMLVCTARCSTSIRSSCRHASNSWVHLFAAELRMRLRISMGIFYSSCPTAHGPSCTTTTMLQAVHTLTHSITR
jgi:hypothetical protein